MDKISRRTWSLAVGVAVAGGLYGCQSRLAKNLVAKPAGMTVYVSPTGNDGWSGKLATANMDGSDGPVGSVCRALEIVRGWRRVQKVAALAAHVILRGGTYELKNSIVIGPEDSGTLDSPLVIRAYPGEEPTISGGVRVANWKVRRDGLWETAAPEGMNALTVNQLFIQGQRQERPRLPTKNWYFMAHVVEQQEYRRRAFRFEKGEFNPKWYALRDVEVVSYDVWTTERQWVESVDPKTDTVYLQDNGFELQAYQVRQRFYIDNVREALNKPGQWYFDRPEKKILYKPMPGQSHQEFSAVVPIVRRLFDLRGAPEDHAYVEHVTIKEVRLEHSACAVSRVNLANDGQSSTVGFESAIFGQGVKNVNIVDCEIAHGGEHAIRFMGATEGVTVQRCHIHDMGGGGVYLGLDCSIQDYFRLPLEVRFTGQCVVDNNFIHDSGKLSPQACGIWIGHSGDNRISHNVIANLYYTGISVGWCWNTAPMPSPAVRNLVEYNRIYNLSNGVLSDGGGIYLLGVSPGTMVRNNWISDLVPYTRYFNGLYLDNGASDIRAENNVVENVAYGMGLLVHQGADNVVVNNYFGRVREVWVDRNTDSQGKFIPLSLAFDRNVVVVTGGNVWPPDSPATIAAGCKFSRNVYWSSRGSAPSLHGEDFKQWQAGGQDAGSLAAKPGLQTVDGIICAEAGSPAERIGFRPIDTRNIGLYGSAAWRALPGTIAPLPIADRAPYPNPVAEPVHTNFQQLKAGAAIYGLTTMGHGNGVVEATPVTGRRAFRLGPQGVTYSYYQPWIRRCKLDLQFSVLVPAHNGTTLCLELRDWRSNPYITGPSVVFGADGGVVANGVPVGTAPLGKWVDVHVLYDYRMGKSGEDYQISLHQAGKALAMKRIPVPGASKFATLTWMGFINQGKLGEECYIGYVDCASAGP
ncbi:MAG: right-handed parallel beta-helix repeat-containing protein [Phycisphaerae bacterium]|nr:right-handed parallel beta-helix repeat-containing protein [Phycisphaerae bacterium]